MTVDDIIERAYRRYLEPAYDRPVSSTLVSQVTSAATTWTLAPFSTIEYGDALQSGTVLEAGTELVRVVTVTTSQSNPDSNYTVTVVRGVMGTTPDAHDAGTEVVVAPMFPRKDVELAAFDEIENLYPDLWAIKQETWDQPPYEVPSDFGSIIELAYTHTDGYRYSLHQGFVGQNSYGDYVVQNIPSLNGTLILTYAAKPARPRASTDALASLGVEQRWADIVAMGVAIQFVTGQNVSDLRLDYLTEMMETQTTEGVGPRDVETNLRRARALRLQEERRRLRSTQQTWTAVRPA